MPLISSILWILVHCLLALALNVVGIWSGLIAHGEIFALYFVIYSARLYDAQMKFTRAYKEDPQLVEQILRHNLLDGGE
jgi:hypothetical protein